MQARVILGSAEAEIAGKFVEAANMCAGNPAARPIAGKACTVNLAIALGCFAFAIIFAVQAFVSLRKRVTVMGLMTAVTAASTVLIGVLALWSGS